MNISKLLCRNKLSEKERQNEIENICLSQTRQLKSFAEKKIIFCISWKSILKVNKKNNAT